MWLDDPVTPISMIAVIHGTAVVAIPVFLAVWLTHYYKRDHSNKKYPEGIVTVENIAKQGEQLGERGTELDSKWQTKAFGFFYKDYEVLAGQTLTTPRIQSSAAAHFSGSEL